MPKTSVFKKHWHQKLEKSFIVALFMVSRIRKMISNVWKYCRNAETPASYWVSFENRQHFIRRQIIFSLANIQILQIQILCGENRKYEVFLDNLLCGNIKFCPILFLKLVAHRLMYPSYATILSTMSSEKRYVANAE